MDGLELAFLGVLVVLAGCGLAARRATRRPTLLGLALLPVLAFLAYEVAVARVMPAADIRLDWLLLFPIWIAHTAHVAARWRRLGAGTGDD